MNQRALMLTICMLALMTIAESSASEQFAYLRISVSGSTIGNAPPRIETGAGAQDKPDYEVQSRTWRVPLRQSANGYFSPYLLSISQGSEGIPVQMNFPVFMIQQDQIVHLSTPSIDGFDETIIRRIWTDSERVSNQDPLLQFRYLHDLLYVNKHIQMEQGLNASATARSTRAALMLLQTIDSLKHRTWYVVGRDTKDVVEKSIKTLSDAQRQGKLCHWLGTKTCANRSVDALVKRVREIDNFHLTKVYSFIYPDNATPSISFCNERIQQISAFLDHIVNVPNISNPSPTRVAQELAACHVTRALCSAPSVEYSISELNTAEIALRRARSNERLWQNRMNDVQIARNALQNGGLAICPVRRSY